MAKGVRELRRRIRSVGSTRQITRAMQLVSAVKMRRAQEAALRTRTYVARATQLLATVAHQRGRLQHPLLEARGSSRTLLVLVTSDRGLAGGLNSNVVRLAQDLLRGELAGTEVEVVTLGKRGADALLRSGVSLAADFSPIPDTAHFSDVSPLTTYAVRSFMDERVDRVVVASTHFVSTIKQVPVTKQVVPLGPELVDFFRRMHADSITHPEHLDRPGAEPLFEPSVQEVLDALLPQLVELQIYQSVLEAQASEHSARMVAMKNATDAAADLIDDLRFSANQLRQSSITQELAEISSGVVALADAT